MFTKTGIVKLWDLIIIILALALTGFSAFAVYVKPQNISRVLIQGRDGQWIFPLDAEETVMVPGPLGNTIIKIQYRQAWVESSPCANQICVAAGHIQRLGIWVACLPNHVFLMIEGISELMDQPDATVW